MTSDVLIIGGGVIGLASALELARAGVHVTVLERGEVGKEASWAGAGIIPPGNPDRATSPADRLRALSSAAIPEFSQELLGLTGIDNGYRRCGGVERVGDEDGWVIDSWRDEGITFSETERGTYLLPDMAQVRNPWHLRAVRKACEMAGVGIVEDAAVIGFQGNGVRLADGSVREADRVLIASGAWSGPLLANLGWPERVHPVRGQIVLFRSPAPPTMRIVLHGKRYLVPREDGRTLVGSTEEPEAGFEKGNTPDAIQALADFAREMVPTLRDAEIERCWSGIRPGSADGLPYIGRVPGWENLFVNAGHFRAGIQLSIASARLIADLMLGRVPCVEPNAFGLDRPTQDSHRPAFRS